MQGTVKWFNAEKVSALLNVKKAMMYSYISALFRLMVSRLLKRVKLLSLISKKAQKAYKQLM